MRLRDDPTHYATPDEVFGARFTARLSQSDSAALVYTTTRSWQQWESGARKCHRAFLELFCRKTGQHEG